MKNNKKTLIISVIIIALVILTIGATYAFFTANINGNESTSTLLATGGTLEIWYENQSGTIELYNIYPKEEAWVSKTFTLTGKNTTDMQMKYSIGLKVDSNTFTSGALSYSLISENTSNNGEIVSPKQNISITKDLHYFGTGHFLTGENLVHTYTLEIYYKDNGQNQNANQGASFTGHIIIIASEIPLTKIALSTSNLSLIGYTNDVVPSSLVIPEQYIDDSGEIYQVTSISDYAFQRASITSLTLNEGLESIGEYAFISARNLTGMITIPSTVKTIGNRAFGVTGITGLTLNEGLENIGEGAFSNATKLIGSITIPSTVKSIGNNAFYMTGITGLTLNEGLESIGENAFSEATNLTGTLTIPSTVKTMGEYAFAETGITGLTLNEGLESIVGGAFYRATNLTGTLTIPSTVTSIQGSAFADTGITGLTLNEGLESIGNAAFSSTDNLTGTLTIPSAVKSIGKRAFDSTGITGLILNEGLESIGDKAFHKAPNFTGTLTIPSTVKTIGEQAFYYVGIASTLKGITGLTLKEGLESIGNSAFAFAHNLTGTLTIPSTVKTIGDSAFVSSGITGLTLKEGLESIGNYAFDDATNLAGTLTIPSTVTSIGSSAFENTGITTINYPGTQAEWNQITIGTDAFPSGVTINYNYTGA